MVDLHDARALADDLRHIGALVYAEPDRVAYSAQAVAPDPLSPRARWRDAVVDPALEPPLVTPRSPLLGLVDSAVDLTHPEFQASQVRTLRAAAVTDSGGTADASIAAAPANGVGILGIWPGMRVVNSPLPRSDGIRCSQVTRRVRAAVDAGAAVISMAYGFPELSDKPGTACFSQYAALQEAVRDGVIPVAAAAMTIPNGQRPGEPATLPHVITAGAIDDRRRPASFMVASGTVDLAAPGVGLLAAVPSRFDSDGNVDGYRGVSGTGAAAAIVGAAAAWLRADDSSLMPDQVASVLRSTAEDLADPGRDRLTGSGLLQIGRALAADLPPADAREPNDDIGWVNGRLLRPAQRVIRSRGRANTITARLDPFEDPHDVYPVRLDAGGGARLRLRATKGDPRLEVYDQTAQSVSGRRRRLGARRTMLVHNPRSRARTLYAHVFIARGADDREAGYRLKIDALKPRR